MELSFTLESYAESLKNNYNNYQEREEQGNSLLHDREEEIKLMNTNLQLKDNQLSRMYMLLEERNQEIARISLSVESYREEVARKAALNDSHQVVVDELREKEKALSAALEIKFEEVLCCIFRIYFDYYTMCDIFISTEHVVVVVVVVVVRWINCKFRTTLQRTKWKR